MAPLSEIRHRDRSAANTVSVTAEEVDEGMLVPLTVTSSLNHDDNYCGSHEVSDPELGHYRDEDGLTRHLLLQQEEIPVSDLELSLWQRTPPGLKVAVVSFCGALLTTLRIVFVYEHQYHSGFYAVVFCLAVASAFGLPAYIILQTFWYNSMELDRTLDQKDRARNLLSQVYPEHVLQRLLEEDPDTLEAGDDQWLENLKKQQAQAQAHSSRIGMPLAQSLHSEDSSRFTSYRHPGLHRELPSQPKSVTDLYPNCTVLYSRIEGFTAWSSTRAPDQIFILLEAIFCEFDELAQQASIFKVEAVADCYMAATGLPEPATNPDTYQADAIRLAQFALDCLASFKDTTEHLERTLGPDTADLKLRIAMNSGPVTGGVLKSSARFQLFGDTVNNAILMEQLGEGNMVHLTKDTATVLQAAGKSHCIEARKASQAGNTYWLTASPGCEKSKKNEDSERSLSTDVTSVSTAASTTVSEGLGLGKKMWSIQDILTAKQHRLVAWTVDQLAIMIKKIVARRQTIQRHEERIGTVVPIEPNARAQILYYNPSEGCVLDEVRDMIEIPRIKREILEENHVDFDSVELSEQVIQELTNYVSSITTFYYDSARNPFHNFTHAAHVLASVVKMMERIISPTQAAMENDRTRSNSDDETTPKDKRRLSRRRRVRKTLSREELTDHTYGIADDPLVQLSCVFAALIHDIDHPGVSNAQLVKEETRLARVYKNRSISEQNSLDMAWDLLMDPSYQCLVRTMCGTQEELKRFRQLLVQTVMATDIADAELRNARNKRWDLVFAEKKTEDTSTSKPPQSTDDTKATIILEHLLQASDISHTMQHFDVFRKWNERLFREMYLAYLSGRAEKDPGEFWFKGEIGFFTYYIIPLAEKLKTCGVFGVSSDEYLNYAQNNLQIWESKGQEIVKELRESVKQEYGVRGPIAA